jgi:hypothetical protein
VCFCDFGNHLISNKWNILKKSQRVDSDTAGCKIVKHAAHLIVLLREVKTDKTSYPNLTDLSPNRCMTVPGNSITIAAVVKTARERRTGELKELLPASGHTVMQAIQSSTNILSVP